MKFLFVGVLAIVATTAIAIAVPSPGRSVYVVPQTYATGLGQDLENLKMLIPRHQLKRLVITYLLNDAEFQAVVRYINSPSVRHAILSWMYEPEVYDLKIWTEMQLDLEQSPESASSEELDLLENLRWTQYTTNGWSGFISELQRIYPTNAIRNFVQQKLAQNGLFAQFWERFITLENVYERNLASPAAQDIQNNLRQLNVDPNQIDQFIRSIFNYGNRREPAPAANVPSDIIQ